MFELGVGVILGTGCQSLRLRPQYLGGGYKMYSSTVFPMCVCSSAVDPPAE